MMNLKKQVLKLWWQGAVTTNNSTASQRLSQIVEHGLCIGCGLCESLATDNSIRLQVVANGTERPVSNPQQPPSEQLLDNIVATCPGTKLAGLPPRLIDDHAQEDDVWGVWQDLFLSYSAEPEIRHMASTGGVLTALALYLLESKTVDFILHAKASTRIPSFGEATISRTREQVLAAAGSRYGPTATLKDIVNIVEQAAAQHQTFAFIGTPCDVTALRNYAKLDSRVDQHCHSMLTMVCGGFMAPTAMQQFIESLGIDYHAIEHIRYRGYGCPGPTTIRLKDGSVVTKSYLDFWGEDDSAWQLPSRCKVCADGIGDAADIAAADSWDGGAPSPASVQTDLGSNAMIVRSTVGLQLINAAISAGYLVRDAAINCDDLSRFQPHQVNKKQAVWARFKGLQEAGNLIPVTQGLRLERLYTQNSDADNQAEQAATALRVKSGKFNESPPN